MSLESQIKFFRDNQEDLSKKYSGKYLIISDDLKVDSFDTLEDAYLFGVKHYGLGKFLLQDCHPNFVGKIQVVSPTVVFA